MTLYILLTVAAACFGLAAVRAFTPALISSGVRDLPESYAVPGREPWVSWWPALVAAVGFAFWVGVAGAGVLTLPLLFVTVALTAAAITDSEWGIVPNSITFLVWVGAVAAVAYVPMLTLTLVGLTLACAILLFTTRIGAADLKLFPPVATVALLAAGPDRLELSLAWFTLLTMLLAATTVMAGRVRFAPALLAGFTLAPALFLIVRSIG